MNRSSIAVHQITKGINNACMKRNVTLPRAPDSMENQHEASDAWRSNRFSLWLLNLE